MLQPRGPARGELAVETAGLTKIFGKTRAVDGVDLAVPAGCVYGFLGPNGAGKPNIGVRHLFLPWASVPSAGLLAAQAGGWRGLTAAETAASHTAAVASPLVTREALFGQAGIIATPGFGELVEVTALLAAQPVPAGRTVAIVSNVGGAGVLAADACTDLGLTVHQPRGLTRRRLHALIPGGGAVTGPIDTTAAVSGETFRRCLEMLAADEDVDAVLALVLPTGATGDLVTAIQQADVNVPLAAVVLNQAESVRLLPRCAQDAEQTGNDTHGAGPDAAGQVPAYGYPEAAAGALARAARYGAWRAESAATSRSSLTSGPTTPGTWYASSSATSRTAGGSRQPIR